MRSELSLLRQLAIGIAALSACACAEARATEKIILRTVAGDLLLNLQPEYAPEHVRQVLKLARAGVYDGTHFYRVHKGFVAQLSTAHERLVPLTAEQAAAIRKI